IKEHLGEAQLHIERNEVLLSAVVKIALEPAALGVLRLHQPLPRRPELVEPRLEVRAQTDVLEHKASLMGEAIDEFLLDRRQALPATLGHAQRAEQLALVAHLDRFGGVAESRQRPPPPWNERQVCHAVGGARWW